jgi:hypothetical protein
MTNTKELYYLKAFYKHNASVKEIEFTAELCDSIEELTNVHIYQRVSKRMLSEKTGSFGTDFEMTIDDILTSIIISDFDMNTACAEYIEEFTDSINMYCFDLDFDTIDYTLTQLS